MGEMNRVKRGLIWLSRIKYCRGFGIQSPNDYRFVRYVINEHSPYYQYAELMKSYPQVDEDDRRLCQLYFRLSNYLQPLYYLDFQPSDEVSAQYVCAGCRGTKAVRMKDVHNLLSFRKSVTDAVLVRFSRDMAVGDLQSVVEKMLEDSSESTIVVMEDICHGKKRHQLWLRMVAHENVRVSYDLYYCGILLFEPRRYKKHYVVNF